MNIRVNNLNVIFVAVLFFSLFYWQVGYVFALDCQSCMAKNETDANFCKQCGKSISNEKILVTAKEIVKLIKNKEFKNLANYVHPIKGVVFSPEYYNPKINAVFSKELIVKGFDNNKKYIWGYFDGSGDTIELTFREFYDKYVYDKDYVNAPEIVLNPTHDNDNNRKSFIRSIKEEVPGLSFVEFYFSGFDKKYEGMDWRSLFLVFENYENKWYLIAIINGHWTI